MHSIIKKYPKVWSFCLTFLIFYFFGFTINQHIKLGVFNSLAFVLGEISCLIGKIFFGPACMSKSELHNAYMGIIVILLLFWLVFSAILQNTKKYYDK